MNIAPQIILLVLTALRISDCSLNHGEPDGTKNAGRSVFGAAITLSLLYWGGFFAPLIAALR